MDRKTEFINFVKEATPFIYKIKQSYYYFGRMTCRQCTENEVDTYLTLMREFQLLQHLPYPKERSDFARINELFEKIIALDAGEYNDALYFKTVHALQDLIAELSDEEIDSLHKQHDNYCTMYRYSQGVTY